MNIQNKDFPKNPSDKDKVSKVRDASEDLGAWLRAHRDTLGLDAPSLKYAKRQEDLARQVQKLSLRELPYGVSPHDLSQTGWGLIYPTVWAEGDRSDGLRSLIHWRRQQLGEEPKSFVPRFPKADDFLADLGETVGTIRLKKLPYYLLIVASPEEISFEFQYHLSLSRAVGRIWFPDADGYKAYAEAVVQAEKNGVERRHEVRLVSTDDDETTEKLGNALIGPVHSMLQREHPDWATLVLREKAASRQRLQALLGGGKTPGLLLASGHGRSYGLEDPEQRNLQGSFVCYPEEGQETEQAADFTADQLPETANDLHGLIAFFFSCYGAGVPRHSSFPKNRKETEATRLPKPVPIAKRPFLSKLSIELLRKGSLAVVGHVDRGWSCSFHWKRGHLDLNTAASLEDSLHMLLRGHRLGHAMRPLNRRYQQLASRLANQLHEDRQGNPMHPADLGFSWTAVNDARNLIVLGDPAVYLLGQRQVEHLLRIDPELFRKIEKRVLASQWTLKEWVEQALKNSVY